jgi:hypothetical protein
MAFALAEDFGIALVEEFGMTARAASRIAVALGERTAMTEAATEASPLLAATTEGEGAIAAEMPGTIDLADASRLAAQAAGAYIAGTAIAQTTKKRKAGKDKSLPPAQEPGSRIRGPYRKAKKPSAGTPMPPKGVSKSTHWYDRTRKKWIKRKRPLKKRPSMRKKAYKKRTTRIKRTYKKKTVKRKYMRSLGSTKYLTHGIVSREHVSYFGFMANGGRDEFLFGAADAVLRAWAGKFHVSILTPDDNWGYGSGGTKIAPRSYQVYYRRKDFTYAGDTGTSAGTRRSLVGTTHKAMCEALMKELREKARSGYLPYYSILFDADTGDNRIYTDNKFGDMLINVTSSMKIKMRNITHPDKGDGADMTDVSKNPLQGVAYEFSGEVPIVKEVLITDDSDMQYFHHRDNERGICFGPQGMRPSSVAQNDGRDDMDGMQGQTQNAHSPFTENEYMFEPPRGSSVFTNCRKQHNIIMPVAREFKHTLKCGFKGTLAGLMNQYNNDRYRSGNIGHCFWLGLRQKFRNNNTIGDDGLIVDSNHDQVTIEYDVETVIRGGARLIRPDTTPQEIKVLQMNAVQY